MLRHAAARRSPALVRRTLLIAALFCVAFTLDGRGAGAAPFSQAVAPPPTSERFSYLGQTGGLVTDFAIRGDLAFVPEGDALTILELGEGDKAATVLSRVSPNQGRIQGIALAGDTAFLITPIGLATVDVHDPLQPEILSFVPGGGEAVKIAGGFAFIAARAAGLRIVNVSDPHLPVLASSFPVPGKAVSIALDVESNLVYVAADEGGLRVIDVSAPDVPREVAYMEPAAGVQQLEVQGETLYLSSGDRILLVDVSRPDSLVTVSEYAPPRRARRVAVSGSYAYVADLDGGLKVFHVAEMARPLLVYAETQGAAYDVRVEGNRVYIADGPDGIRIMDVSIPTRPRAIAQLPLDGVAQGLELWAEDILLVAAGEAGLYLVYVGNERSPAVLGRLDTEGEARDVKAGEYVAYVADGPAGLAVISLVDRTSPKLRGRLYTAGEAQALGVWSTFVYVAADDGGLQIVDAIRPAAPFLVGELSLPEGQRAVDIALVNKRAYLAVQGADEDETGLAIADVGFRDRPVVLSRVPGPGVGVAVRGVKPMTVGGTGLMTVDARASSGPVLLARYRPPFGAGGMEWAEGILYLTSGRHGPELTLLDVSEPGRVRERLHLGLTTEGGAVTTLDGQVYLAAGRRGLRSIWISAVPAPPEAPARGPEYVADSEQVIYDPMDTLLQLFALPDGPTRLYGAGEAGWSITDVQDPRLPQPVSRVQTDALVGGLARSGDRVYAALARGGLYIYDSSDPARPQFLGKWSASASVGDVLARDGYLYVVDRQVGLRVLDPNPPEHPTLLQALSLPGVPEQIVHLDPSCTDPGRCDLAYVLAGKAGLRLVDLGHPTAGVVPLGHLPVDVVTVRAVWPYAYTLDGGRFAVWELPSAASSRDGVLPSQVSGFRLNGHMLLVAGDQAFVGSDAGHVSIVDINDPASPRVVGMMGNGAAVRGLASSGEYLIVGLETIPGLDQPVGVPTAGQLRVWNIRNPVIAEEITTVETPSAFAVMAQAEMASSTPLAAPGSGVRIVTAGEELVLFDVAPEPSHSITVTVAVSVPLPAPAISLQLDGDMAYVGTESGLLIFAGLEADGPRIVGEFPVGGSVRSVAVYGKRGYLVADGIGGLLIDVSDRAAPRKVGNLPSPTGDPPRELVVAGDQIWGIWDGQVSWWDVSQPQPGPSEIGAFEPSGIVPLDLVVDGDRAYLTDAEAGLVVLDISDPAAPSVIGSLDTPGQAHAVALAADGLTGYLADGECGVRAFSLENPAAPVEVGFWHSGYALDVAALEDRVYVADIGELVALEFDPNGEAALPPAPQSPQPADGARFYPLSSGGSSETVTSLSWGPSPTQCDPLTYDVFLGTENPPPLLASGLHSPTFDLQGLEPRQTYFWQVVASDRQGDESAGRVWQFHIRTDAQPPPAPTPAPRPELPAGEQQDVFPLVGGLAALGTIAGALWLVRERSRL